VRADTVKSASLLREARLRAGLSQAELAQRAGKPRPHITRYEAGTSAPSLDALIELIRACGFDLPLELVAWPEVGDDDLADLQALSPERRLDRMLDLSRRRRR
jgi:transcriptional regulator with XRE-family HTH domain